MTHQQNIEQYLATAADSLAGRKFIVITGPKATGKTTIARTILAGDTGLAKDELRPINHVATEKDLAAQIEGQPYIWVDDFRGRLRSPALIAAALDPNVLVVMTGEFIHLPDELEVLAPRLRTTRLS